jgi:hypothetical protein
MIIKCSLNVHLNYGRILRVRNLSKQSLKKERNRLFRNIKVIKTTKIDYILCLTSKNETYYTSNVLSPIRDMVPYFYTDFYQFYSYSYKSGAKTIKNNFLR